MGLSSLANAPAISKPCGESRSRLEDRSIDALFDEAKRSKTGLVGIDEDTPLELPLPKLVHEEFIEPSGSRGDKKPISNSSEECKLDEESFKKNWAESFQHSSSPKLDRKIALDSFLSHAVETKSKDDEWGENTDVLLMLPDGSDAVVAAADSKPKAERAEKRLFVPKKSINDRVETGYEFGEYQPSCLTAGRTPIAGRRRSSPTSVSPKLSTEGTSASPTPEESIFASKIANEQQSSPQAPRVKFRSPQHSPVEVLSSQDSQDAGAGFDKRDKDNSLFERLRQTLISKGVVETEKNQLSDEVKRLRDENCVLKDDVLKAEKEKLRVVKEMSEMEISSTSAICKQFSEEKEEAQKIIVHLSSEIHLLKNTCTLTDEKLSSLQTVYQEEVDMLKESHAREIEVKEKQLSSERSFLANQKYTVETLTDLLSKSNSWSKQVDEIQNSMVSDREQSNKFRTEWMERLEKSVNQQHASINTWCSTMHKQLEDVLSSLSVAVQNVKELQSFEKDNLSKERSSIHALQETVQSERAQSLADLASTKQKLEEIRNTCFQEKDSFLQKCFEEKKELALERDALLRMKEQLYHADAALEKQLIEHSTRIQSETGELNKQRAELERARVMAAEIAQEVEDGRRELELRYQAFHKEQRPCRGEEDGRTNLKHKQMKRASESQLLRLIQHNPCSVGRKMKRKFELGSEELMANTEALLRLQEQQDFLQEAKNNLQVNKQWSKKFWSGKKII